MRTWFANLPSSLPLGFSSACTVGRFGLDLVCSTDAGEIGGSQPQAWLLPAGQGADFGRITELAAGGRPVLVAVNGLGDGAIANLRDAAGDRLVLCFDGRGISPGPFLEQLAWLSAQTVAFAILSDDNDQLMAGAALGAWGLVITGGMPDLAGILRLVRARQPAAPRPISPAEFDSVGGAELCLVAACTKRAGEVLAGGDIAIAVTQYRGLAPTLHDRVTGKRLRYPVEAGDPLHFGLLDDAHER